MKNGKHLIIDAYNCFSPSLREEGVIKKVLYDITDLIKLRPLSEAMIFEVTEDMLDKEGSGLTGGIIFMESHFTFHAFPEMAYFSADIYSCKNFDHDRVVTYIDQVFRPLRLDQNVILRGTAL
tara:strand:- start:168 stop:536 length:369 start_codon:yes stop_codon:yes gene_type:complete